jgi:hypothetical protein
VLRIRKLLLAMLVLAVSVHAIGIAPGTIDLKPGQYNISFLITNKADTASVVSLTSYGEFGITFAEQTIMIAPHGEYLCHASLSYSYLEPGRRTAWISAEEKPEDDQVTVSARTGVIAAVNIDVPMQGKHLRAEVKGDDRAIVIRVTNIGDETIDHAHAAIDVRDWRQEKRIMTDAKPVLAGRSRELVALHNLSTGDYSADVRILFDGKEALSDLDFRIGQPSVELVSQSWQTAGDFSRLRLAVRAGWNRNLTAYATMSTDSLTMQSSEVILQPDRQGYIDIFWPASEGLPQKLFLHYDGIISGYEIEVRPVMEAPSRPLFWLISLFMLLLIVTIWRFHARKR